MKTTVEIADGLLAEAKLVAQRRKLTLRELIQEGLRAMIERERQPERPFKLKDGSFRGTGLVAGVTPDQLPYLSYDRDRGGK